VRLEAGAGGGGNEMEVVDAFMAEELGDDDFGLESLDLDTMSVAPKPQVLQVRKIGTPEAMKIESLGSIGADDEVEQFIMEEGD